MDFAVLSERRVRDHLQVPCLATEDYDGGEFEQYPDRQGWHERPIREWTSIFTNPRQNFLGFLQTWLFFAPIALVFRRRVSLEAFTKPGTSGLSVIDTSILQEWFRSEPVFRLNRETEEAKLGMMFTSYAYLHHGLQQSHNALFNEDRRMSLQSYIQTCCRSDPRDAHTIMATTLLLETLTEYTFCSGRSISDQKPFTIAGARSLSRLYASPLHRQMREDGWCPSTLFVFFKRINTASLCFLRSMARPHPERVHKMIRIRAPRAEPTGQSITGPEILCSEEKCAFLQLSDKTYKTKHTDDYCDKSKCDDMVADPKEIFDILRSGSIPLMLSIDDDDDDSTLILIPSQPDFSDSYVAISHVWSDGLGNVEKSALPRCQIKRLSKMIRGLPGISSNMVLFWIDTIGCPPDSAGEVKAQQLAISMMRETYQNAVAVLVLDGWLQTQRIAGLPDHEVLMMIISSAWNSRLWTLQEGVLAQNLFFQFDDAVYNIDEGLRRLLHESTDPVLRWTLSPAISERVYEFRGFSRTNVPAWQKLNALRAALSTRTTSVETDEPLCLAALLGFNRAQSMKITQADPQDRMRIFWSLMEDIPHMLIFDDYPRLKIQGYRWAPRSFLGKIRSFLDPPFTQVPFKPAKNTKSGLRIETGGLAWSMGRGALRRTIHLFDEDNLYYRITCDLEELDKTSTRDVTSLLEPSQMAMAEILRDGRAFETTADLYELYGADLACFLFMDDVRGGLQYGVGGVTGMLAVFEILYSGVIHVKRVCGGHCILLRPGVDDAMMGNIATFPIQRSSRMDDTPGSITFPTGVALDTSGIFVLGGARVFGMEQAWVVN
jgi:hypothetical protein